ncbi:MAG TPA: alkaline phosphatase family protein, partial [bacterium]|nr:alkaline phosphatase family protein [bacterium]
AGKYVFETYHPDLFMIYLKSTDRVEHFLWGAHTDFEGDPIRKQEAEVIFGWYRYYDGLIQQLLADPGRTLMVISDHGMRAQSAVPEPYYIWDIDFDGILELIGYLNRHAGGTDWDTTRAYTYRHLPYDKSFIVRLNMTGREPRGSVNEDMVLQTVRDVIRGLSALQTSDGRPLFASVGTTDAPGEILCRLSDDVTLDDAFESDGQRFIMRDLVIRKGLPRGIHTDAPPGIIAVLGPGIAPGTRVTGASVFDVTPTALHLLNLPTARDFDGRVLIELFDPEYLAAHPVESIPTYGRRTVESRLSSSGGDERMLDELRALGYIQ